MKAMPESQVKSTPGQWAAFAVISLTHYGAICAYIFLWSSIRQETTLSNAVFFTGLIAWMLQPVLYLYFRRRNPAIGRLSLFIFVSSFLLGFLLSSPTD
jgi:FtsH-binding integral membrane protein